MNNLDRGINIAILLLLAFMFVQAIIQDGLLAAIVWLLFMAASVVGLVIAGMGIAWVLNRRGR